MLSSALISPPGRTIRLDRKDSRDQGACDRSFTWDSLTYSTCGTFGDASLLVFKVVFVSLTTAVDE